MKETHLSKCRLSVGDIRLSDGFTRENFDYFRRLPSRICCASVAPTENLTGSAFLASVKITAHTWFPQRKFISSKCRTTNNHFSTTSNASSIYISDQESSGDSECVISLDLLSPIIFNRRWKSSSLCSNINLSCSDPDFSGYVELSCHAKCSLVFHCHCWKVYKEQHAIKRLTDRVSSVYKLSISTGTYLTWCFPWFQAILGEPCLTPDCNSVITGIAKFDKDGKATHCDSIPYEPPAKKQAVERLVH